MKDFVRTPDGRILGSFTPLESELLNEQQSTLRRRRDDRQLKLL